MIHCFMARYEADGYDLACEWLADYPGKMDMDWNPAWDECFAICMLEEGHEGAHEFTPTSEIVLSFR